MLDTILDSPLSQWLCQDTEATDHIVISSRISRPIANIKKG